MNNEPQQMTVSMQRYFKRVGKTIKQVDNWSCVVCCIQMLTFAPRQDILKIIGRVDRGKSTYGVSDIKTARALMEYGVFYGTTIFYGLDNALNIDSSSNSIATDIQIKGLPAMVTVTAKTFKNRLHAVMWDGFNIRDPDLSMPEVTKFEDYKIVNFVPLGFNTAEAHDNFINYYKP